MGEFKELPWKLILEKVPLANIIKLRRVNQQWRFLVDLMLSEKRELALFFGEGLPCMPYYWHYNDQQMNLDNLLPANYTGICGSQWFSRQFRDITSLMMIVPPFYRFLSSNTSMIIVVGV